MSLGCFSKEPEKFQNRILNIQRVRFKKFKKMIHKHYLKLTHKHNSKIDPQTLL